MTSEVGRVFTRSSAQGVPGVCVCQAIGTTGQQRVGAHSRTARIGRATRRRGAVGWRERRRSCRRSRQCPDTTKERMKRPQGVDCT
eukprot:3702321-Pleurochrysis_carterae.AAC.7